MKYREFLLTFVVIGCLIIIGLNRFDPNPQIVTLDIILGGLAATCLGALIRLWRSDS